MLEMSCKLRHFGANLLNYLCLSGRAWCQACQPFLVVIIPGPDIIRVTGVIVKLNADKLGAAFDAKSFNLALLRGGQYLKVWREGRNNSVVVPFEGWEGGMAVVKNRVLTTP